MQAEIINSRWRSKTVNKLNIVKYVSLLNEVKYLTESDSGKGKNLVGKVMPSKV